MSSEENIKILSMNCQGLADIKKRRDVFHYLRSKSFSVYFLQDVHLDQKMIKYVKAEWGYTCFFAPYATNSRGVAILFNNNFEFKVEKVTKDQGGNFLYALVTIQGKKYLMINIYGPNRDDPSFYLELEERVKEFKFDYLIMGGDWNLVMNFSLDYDNYKHCNNSKAQEQVETMMSNLELIDIWRDLNPDVKRYTWRRNNPLQQSRLDFFLISETLFTDPVEADILPGYRTDHSIITLTLNAKSKQQKSGLWKFNSSLLSDKDYVNEIKDQIRNVLSEYALTPYLRSNIDEIPRDEIQFVITDQLLLDTLLMKIRAKTISFATMKKRKSTKDEISIKARIELLEKKNMHSVEELTELEKLKTDLISLREKRMEGVLLRSRTRWIAEGERITRYFCSLEKRNYISKHINYINKKGDNISEPGKIAQEVNCFYKTLYAERVVENIEITDLLDDLPKLSEKDKSSLENEITLEEASWALKNMKNKKSPGSDGFTAEFFKFFWQDIGMFVVRSLNEGYRKGELSSTQKEGIIICIPKENKPREYIENWRPISLLNVVYKIGSSCIANRLKCVLPSLISEDQTGFIMNRYLGDNIRLIYDLINYLNCLNKPGLLILLDFQKAFDTLSWTFMRKVLKAFNFGPDLMRWIQTFYYGIKSTVIVNGQLTPWFPVCRGCRQGDPVSPYLFVLSVEIMAAMIRQNPNIKGIIVKEIENKIAQLADDTELMLEGDQESFEESFKTINKFERASGLTLNTNKSCAIWLGSMKNSLKKYMPHLDIQWNPKQFKILGIWFTNDLEECVKLNFDDKFKEIKILFQAWLRRELTPLGRVAVLKSLILSKLVFLWMLLPNPPDDLINAIQLAVYQFVWNRKNDRISRKISHKNIEQGGINIPDIRKYIHALKITWIKKLLTGSYKWNHIVLTINNKIPWIRLVGTELDIDRTNHFWYDVFKAYSELGKRIEIKTFEEFIYEPLFRNPNILIAGKVFLYQKWIRKNVYCVGNLIDDQGQLLSLNDFLLKYDIQENFLTYAGVVNAVKKFLEKCRLQLDSITYNVDKSNKLLNLIRSAPKGAKLFYNILTLSKEEPHCCQKWNSRINITVPWKVIFRKAAKIKEVKLKWLQIRIIHRILGTNSILLNMKLEDNDKCTFCKNHKENIQHIFWNCQYAMSFWMEFQESLHEKCEVTHNFQFTQHIILFGCEKNVKTDTIIDLLIMLGKSFIYRCKMKKIIPYFRMFVHTIKYRYRIEKYIARIQMTYEETIHDWDPYIALCCG